MSFHKLKSNHNFWSPHDSYKTEQSHRGISLTSWSLIKYRPGFGEKVENQLEEISGQNVIDILSIYRKILDYILTQIAKVLLTSCPYIGKSLAIFWPKLTKCYWHLVNILEKKLTIFLTQIGKILLTACQYVGGSLNIFWPKLAKYFWHLVNILAIAWTYFDSNW